jgi:hypothetical protein
MGGAAPIGSQGFFSSIEVKGIIASTVIGRCNRPLGSTIFENIDPGLGMAHFPA